MLKKSITKLSPFAQQMELIYMFALRNIKSKYQIPIVGVLWNMLQPVSMALIFSIYLGRSFDQLNYPYFYYALSGFVLWGFFSQLLTSVANSVVTNQGLLAKTPFPRMTLPYSYLLSALFDLMINSTAFWLFLLIKGFEFSSLSYLASLFLSTAMFSLLGIGLGLLLSILIGLQKDLMHIIGFIIQLLLFATPVIYPGSLLEGFSFYPLFEMIPINITLEVFRTFLSGESPSLIKVLVGIGSSAALFTLAWYLFKKFEFYLIERL
jgi:lipopolysaccharide transport system permease protein